MTYILFGIIAILMLLVLYNPFGSKNDDDQMHRAKTNFETKNNLTEQKTASQGQPKVIKRGDYVRFIFLKQSTQRHILKGIKAYGELSGNDVLKTYKFGIAHHKNWHIVKVDEGLSFYVYHNLVGWLTDGDEDTAIPERLVGFSKHKTNVQEDYLFYLDPENGYKDTHIGTFRNGRSFSIYLPEAYEDHGNLTIQDHIQVSMKAQTKILAEQGLHISDIDALNYIEHKIKMFD